MPETQTSTTQWQWDSNNWGGNFGIDCSTAKLIKWECTMKPYETLWIQPKNQKLSSFTKDAIWWATMFIGFLVFAALIYSGVLLIMWWWNEQMISRWKEWIKYSLIWLLLVGMSYWIIQIIQALAGQQ